MPGPQKLPKETNSQIFHRPDAISTIKLKKYNKNAVYCKGCKKNPPIGKASCNIMPFASL